MWTTHPSKSCPRRPSAIQPSYFACFWADRSESAAPLTYAAKQIASALVVMGGFGDGTHKIDSTSGNAVEFALVQDTVIKPRMTA